MNYPDADRLVPATEPLLPTFGAVHIIAEPYGRRPVIGCLHRPGAINGLYEVAFRYGGSLTDDEFPLSALWLDPMDAATRDHLIRRLSLPGWMRDGAGLEPWQSAGLIACAVARQHERNELLRALPMTFDPKQIGTLWPTVLMGVWDERQVDTDGTVRASHIERWSDRDASGGNPRVRISLSVNPPTACRLCDTTQVVFAHAESGKLAADTAALAHGCALMLDADTMVLPWPGGPRVWRRG